MREPTDFPEIFSRHVHDYLKTNQNRYGGQYRTYFLTQFSKLEQNLFEMSPRHYQPKSFPSICCIAGKMCGLFSFTYSNDTLVVLLEAVKEAYKKCGAEKEKTTLKKLFGNKTAEEVTKEDLLEIGLYGEVSDHSNRSPGKRLIRYENLKTIYAGEHQRWQRQESSFPEYAHYWVTIEKTPGNELLSQSELCTTQYTVSTTKTNDPGKIHLILQTSKKHIQEPIEENVAHYFLSQLEQILRNYYDGRLNFFRLKYQSAASSRLYSTLYDIILNDSMTPSQRIDLIITTLNAELRWIQQLPEQEREKPRRLITALTEAGFMTPDVLNNQPVLNVPSNAQSQSTPDEKQAAHPSTPE